MKRAYIFFNGELLGSKDYYLELLKRDSGDIYCADGGANLLEELGILPMEIWGDFDSVSPEILDRYSESGCIPELRWKPSDFLPSEGGFFRRSDTPHRSQNHL